MKDHHDETYVASVADLLDEYVVCRTIGHSWDDNPGAQINSIWSWALALRCTRCKTERVDALSNLGEVIARRYIYPAGYRVVRDRPGGQVTRLEMRAEMMRRRVLARRKPSKAALKRARQTDHLKVVK